MILAKVVAMWLFYYQYLADYVEVMLY